MTALETVTRTLADAGVTVSPTAAPWRDYKQGVCFVLLDRWDSNVPAEAVTVVATVGVGGRLDEYVGVVCQRLADAGLPAVGFAASYGSAPIGGRDMPPGDVARLSVVTGHTRPTRPVEVV